MIKLTQSNYRKSSTYSVLTQLNVEANVNTVNLYDDALASVFDTDSTFESLASVGFDRDALEMMYEIEMDNA